MNPDQEAPLKLKINDYVASMEKAGSGVNYQRAPTDLLLILEALNDWSSRQLAEGGEIRLTTFCTDPACATYAERNELISRMYKHQGILYPVSGFNLSAENHLRFNFEEATFRMMPNTGGSRMDGIGIAESSHVRDAEAAFKLWAFCATEDCIAYLINQAEEHNLAPAPDTLDDCRQIISSALMTHFSLGQVWNAIWRSVRNAATLSTRTYYNIPKASKTIPKKIDKILTKYSGSLTEIEPYERIPAQPLGAVLSLLLRRFGIADDTPGPTVRTIFIQDAQLAPPSPDEETEEDDGRSLVTGTMYFSQKPTPLDLMVLGCFEGLNLETTEPVWDDQNGFGHIHYTLNAIDVFNGPAFLRLYLAARGIPEPTQEDIARHALELQKAKANGEHVWDFSGKWAANQEALIKAGVSPAHVGRVALFTEYFVRPEYVMNMLHYLPDERGLQAIRADYVHVNSEFFEQDTGLHTCGMSFRFLEERMEPEGSDIDLVSAAASDDLDRIAALVATTVLRNVDGMNDTRTKDLLKRVAARLIEESTPPEPEQKTIH